MSKAKIKEQVESIAVPYLESQNMSLFNIEYVKEGKDWVLRVFIDKDDNVSTDDCELVSRYLSEKLDEIDIIDKNYFLEVSSPGIDRPLIKDADYETYKGEMIEIHLYKALDGSKQIIGKLESLNENVITIIDQNDKKIEIVKDQASKVNLAVIF